jgi:hypothetical protein
MNPLAQARQTTNEPKKRVSIPSGAGG